MYVSQVLHMLAARTQRTHIKLSCIAMDGKRKTSKRLLLLLLLLACQRILQQMRQTALPFPPTIFPIPLQAPLYACPHSTLKLVGLGSGFSSDRKCWSAAITQRSGERKKRNQIINTRQAATAISLPSPLLFSCLPHSNKAQWGTWTYFCKTLVNSGTQ